MGYGAWIRKRNRCLCDNAIAKFDMLRNQLFHTGRAFPMGPIFGTRSGHMTTSVATTAKKHRLVRARISLVGRKGSLKTRANSAGHDCVWCSAQLGKEGFNFFGSYVWLVLIWVLVLVLALIVWDQTIQRLLQDLDLQLDVKG